MAIPASTVLLVATGGVLIYAGFSNQNPLIALREVASGKPSPVRNESSTDLASYASTLGPSGGGSAFIDYGTEDAEGGIASAGYADTVPGEGLPTLPRAVERFAGDRYSQTKRWANGYSDCSSFVGKGLKVLGVKPPTGSTTTSYLASSEWKRVRADDVRPGDLACSLNHVVVCYGNGRGIGQQNKRANVKRDTIKNLMYGNTPFVYLRYVSGNAQTPKAVMA